MIETIHKTSKYYINMYDTQMTFWFEYAISFIQKIN